MENGMWTKLAIMTVVSFVVMYFLMYSMIDGLDDLYLNINQVYMAGSMTTAMIAIELIVMSAMYKNARIRNILIGTSILLTAVLVLFIRYQTGVGNTQFLRSMIPHHSGAILMCANPDITEPELKTLCRAIIEGQRKEIDQMNTLLGRAN